MRHMVPAATGAMIMGTSIIERMMRAPRPSPESIIANITPKTSSKNTVTKANSIVFCTLRMNSGSLNIRR